MSQFNVKRVALVKSDKTNTLAFADVEVSGMLLKALRVVKGSKNVFVSMPSELRKDKEGNAVLNEEGNKIYDDRFFPTTAEIRDNLNAAVLAAFNTKIESVKASENIKS